MQAFITWISNWVEAFFTNLKEWFEGIIQWLQDWFIETVDGVIIPAIVSALGDNAELITSQIAAVHAPLVTYYPVVNYFLPLSQVVTITLAYVAAYFVLWPLKLVVRALMALL